jgi:hypothetical protein
MRYPSIAQPHELAAFEPTSKNVYLLRDAAWPPLEAVKGAFTRVAPHAAAR